MGDLTPWEGPQSQADAELGEARVRMVRLADELARARGVTRDRILAALMATRLWREMGSPDLGYVTLGQARGLARLLGRWLEKERGKAKGDAGVRNGYE